MINSIWPWMAHIKYNQFGHLVQSLLTNHLTEKNLEWSQLIIGGLGFDPIDLACPH